MQRGWWGRVLVEEGGSVVDEGRIAQLPHRNIDRDGECRMLHAPAPALRQRRVQHPVAALADQPGLLSQRDEVVRKYQALLGMIPEIGRASCRERVCKYV